MITNTTPHTVNALASNGPCSHATGSSPQYSSSSSFSSTAAAPRSWWQRLSHCFSHAKSSPQSAAAHGGSVPYGGAASPSTAQGAAQSAVLNQGAWLGQSAQVDVSVDEFDRYQLCTEGMTVCANGWERYKVHNEAELLEFNLGRINVLRRSLSCSNEEFNFYVVPLIKSMTRYCLIVPASEGHHDAEVGGLVKHNLQIGIAALELMNQSRTIRISDSVRLNNLFAQAKARKQAAVAAQANATAQEMATAQGDDEEQLDTLARYLRAASDPRAVAARKEMEKKLQETSAGERALNLSTLQQNVILALQQWRERLDAKLHERFSEQQISFMMELMVLFHCFAHDLAKLVYDLEIVASNGERYSPYVQELAQFCEEQHCPYLFLRYVRNRSTLHQTQGMADGYILLARFCWQCMILLAQVSPLGQMLTNPESVLDLVRKFTENSVIAGNMRAQSVGQLYIPSYVNVLIKRLYEARTQDGVLPNKLDSDFYTSNNHVLIQNQSRAWALLSWWVQEQEFGPMDMHLQSNANLINKLLLTGNVSRVLQNFTTKSLYFMVFLPDSLLLVRGVDLCSSGLSFPSDVTFTHVVRKHPLLQQALHAIVLALYHQHQDSLSAINAAHHAASAATAPDANNAQVEAALSSESLTIHPDNIEDCSTWNAETLSQMDFDANPALTSVFAHPRATTPHSTATVGSAAAPAQPLDAVQQEQLQNYRHEQMQVWLQQHQQPQNSTVGDICDMDAITNCDFDPSQAVASLLAQAPSLAQNPSSEHGSASPIAPEEASSMKGDTAQATSEASVAQAENTAHTVNTASAKEGDNTVKAETANQVEPSRPPYQETADAATSTSSSTGSATGGAGQNIHCSWQEVEFVDMPIPERFTLLKARTTLKQLESGRTWLSRLLAMPNKIAFCPYLGADGIYHTHIKVYFAAQDQDFKKFCKKRSDQRYKSNRTRERAAAALGRKASQRAARDSDTCCSPSTSKLVG